MNRANHGAAGNPSEGALAALMVPQVCPRTVRSLDPTEPMAPVAARAASSGECGGPDGDAAQAAQKKAAALRAAAMQQHPKGASAALMGTQLHPREPEAAAAAVIAKSTITTAKTVSGKQDAREFQNSRLLTKNGECGGPDGNAAPAMKSSGECDGPDGNVALATKNGGAASDTADAASEQMEAILTSSAKRDAREFQNSCMPWMPSTIKNP